jgi:hypothetical protein
MAKWEGPVFCLIIYLILEFVMIMICGIKVAKYGDIASDNGEVYTAFMN